MTHKDQGSSLLKLSEKAHALLGEDGVSNGKSLVDHQDVRVNMRDDSKGKPYEHSAGIGFDRLVNEISDVSEGSNSVEALANLLLTQSQHCCVEKHVLTSRELGVKSRAELQERGYSAIRVDVSLGGAQRSTQ
jgi:hypothetical protein